MSKKRGGDNVSSRETIGSKKLLGELTHRKINYYLSKTYLDDADFYKVFKEFFTELLEIKYEFTCNELIKELDKVYLDESIRARLRNLIAKVNIIEYKEKAYKDEEIKKMFEELKNLVNILIKNNNTVKKGFFAAIKRLFGVKEKESESQIVRRKTNKKDEKEKQPQLFESDSKIEEDTPQNNKESEVESVQIQDVTADIAPRINKVVKDVPREINFEDMSQEQTNVKYEETDWHEEPQKSTTEESSNQEKPVEELISTEEIIKKESKKPKDETLTQEVKITPEIKKQIRSTKKTNIADLITEAKKVKTKTTLKKKYKKILKEYDTLSTKEQHKYYPEITKLYNKISKK